MKSSDALNTIAKKELIGNKAKVTKSSDPSQEGIQGKIVDETLKTITLENEEEKKLQKKNITLEIKFPDKTIEIQGKKLMQRPHERQKKLWKKTDLKK